MQWSSPALHYLNSKESRAWREKKYASDSERQTPTSAQSNPLWNTWHNRCTVRVPSSAESVASFSVVTDKLSCVYSPPTFILLLNDWCLLWFFCIVTQGIPIPQTWLKPPLSHITGGTLYTQSPPPPPPPHLTVAAFYSDNCDIRFGQLRGIPIGSLTRSLPCLSVGRWLNGQFLVWVHHADETRISCRGLLPLRNHIGMQALRGIAGWPHQL